MALAVAGYENGAAAHRLTKSTARYHAKSPFWFIRRKRGARPQDRGFSRAFGWQSST